MALEVTPSREETRELVASKMPQFLAAFFATLSALAAGACIAWSSPVLPLLEATHVVSEDQAAWVGALITLGGFSGALPAGWLANLVGRKGLLVLSAVPMLFSWGFICFSPTVWGLYVGRVLAGLGIGVVSVAAPMYISEISEASVRGTLGTFFQLQMTVGVLFVYIVGLLKNVLYISLICASLPLVFLCTFVWMPESPNYLLNKGHDKAASEALQWLRGFHYNIQPELGVLSESLALSRARRGSVFDLVGDRGSARALLVCLGLMVFQQLSAVNAVIFYSQQIFEAAGSSMDPTTSTIIFGVVQVLATYSSTVLIDRAGRRGLLLLSASTMSLCLALVGVYFFLGDQSVLLPSGLPLAFLAVFIFVFSLGFGPVPWVVTGELFPDNLKGVASSMAASVSWLLAFIVTYFFNMLKNNLGYSYTFWMFSGFCFLGTVFVALLLPETKGKNFETIQEELRGEKNPSSGKRLSTETISRLL